MDLSEKERFIEAFGHRVKQLRIEMGLSQEELANRVGYTSDNARSSISKLESGQSDLPVSKIFSFAKALKVSVNQLLPWEEQYNPNSRLASEVEIIELIAKQFDEDAAYVFSEFIKLDNAEAKKILELISMYGNLDEIDRAEIRGYIFSKIENMLNEEKYRKKESS